MTNLGVEVANNKEFPEDPYSITRHELMSRMKARRPYKPQHALRQFLENDRKVLRFFCVWDDTNDVYGNIHHMVIHYYLSDDTIEIRERLDPKHGGHEQSQHSVLFLRRCKLPKRTVKGFVANTNANEYYTDRDFIIGTVIHLYGRPFIICGCDEFTKAYYAQKYGVEQFDPIAIEDLQPEHEPPVERYFPAFEEKTETEPSLVGIVGQGVHPPKPHHSMDGIVLRFAGRLQSDYKYDQERKFVISLYLANHSISVFEQKPGKGVDTLGGKFLEKGRIRKFPSSDFYTSNDFNLGMWMSSFI